MKILYLSDLDWTLLGPNERVSSRTANIVNRLIKEGGCFSYATARSLLTAKKVTAGLDVQLPVICYNGAFIFDSASKEILLANYFSPDKVGEIRKASNTHGLLPLVYSFLDGEERFSVILRDMSAGLRIFLDARKNDPRRREVTREDELYVGDIFYFTFMGDKGRLDPLYAQYKDDEDVNCLLQKDIYIGAHLLEIMPKKATKANAALRLKEMLGCDRLVVFGDGLNDMSLFLAADECYAVENAVPELKEIATAVIGSNDSEGVATWLERNVL